MKSKLKPWPGGSVGQSVTPYARVLGSIPQSGHIQKSTSECIMSGSTNQCFSLSVSLSLSISQKDKKERKKIPIENKSILNLELKQAYLFTSQDSEVAELRCF